MGSAEAQNKIPIAIVVIKVIANQFQTFNMGLASCPPIRIRPSGERAAQTQVKTKTKAAMAKAFEKLANIQSLIDLAVFKKALGLNRLEVTRRKNSDRGAKKTSGRSLKLLRITSKLYGGSGWL